MDVAADGFVEQLEDAMTRVLARHRCENVAEILDEREDHERISFDSLPPEAYRDRLHAVVFSLAYGVKPPDGTDARWLTDNSGLPTLC